MVTEDERLPPLQGDAQEINQDPAAPVSPAQAEQSVWVPNVDLIKELQSKLLMLQERGIVKGFVPEPHSAEDVSQLKAIVDNGMSILAAKKSDVPAGERPVTQAQQGRAGDKAEGGDKGQEAPVALVETLAAVHLAMGMAEALETEDRRPALSSPGDERGEARTSEADALAPHEASKAATPPHHNDYTAMGVPPEKKNPKVSDAPGLGDKPVHPDEPHHELKGDEPG